MIWNINRYHISRGWSVYVSSKYCYQYMLPDQNLTQPPLSIVIQLKTLSGFTKCPSVVGFSLIIFSYLWWHNDDRYDTIYWLHLHLRFVCKMHRFHNKYLMYWRLFHKRIIWQKAFHNWYKIFIVLQSLTADLPTNYCKYSMVLMLLRLSATVTLLRTKHYRYSPFISLLLFEIQVNHQIISTLK